MSLRKLYPWLRTSSKDWDGVTRHFRENVRVFSRAVVVAQSSQIRKIAGATRGQADSQRRRLQRFIQHKQPMAAFFANWTRSVLKTLGQRQLGLGVDETKLKDAWGVMLVGVVYEGRCIPLRDRSA